MTGAALKSVKEQLRDVPDRGLSYGLLRYFGGDSEPRAALVAATPQSDLLFNYLGQFDQVVAGSELFGFAAESTGPWHGPTARRTHALEVLCLVRDGKLEADWIYQRERCIASDASNAWPTTSSRRCARVIVHCLRPASAAAPRRTFRLPSRPGRCRSAMAALPRLRGRISALSRCSGCSMSMEGTARRSGFEQWQFRLEGPVDAALLRLARSTGDRAPRHAADGLRRRWRGEPLQVVLREAALALVGGGLARA